MALSDVNVTVNITSGVGVEPIWYPLFVTRHPPAADSPLAKIKSIEYAECSSLQQLVDLLAPYAENETRVQHREKQDIVKKTGLYQAVEQMFRQNGHPNRFAVIVENNVGGSDFNEFKNKITPYLDRSWRQLVPVEYFSPQDLFELAEYIENLDQRKMLYCSLSSISSASVEDSESGRKYSLSDYTRTVCVYSTVIKNYPHAAVVGAAAGKEPGSINYRNLILNNVTPIAVTEEELEALHEAGFMVPVERAGDVVISQGNSASGIRSIDTLDIEDYAVQQLMYVSQKALNVNDIVPYNNDGIAVLENAAVSVMLDCCAKGMIAVTDTNSYEYNVSYPSVSSVPDEDISDRIYKLGTVSFTVQGAIDKEEITVDMSL